MMTSKTKKITGWVLTGILAFVFLSSASMKLVGGEEALNGAAAMGLSAPVLRGIAMLEVFSVILFVIPRTALLGTLFLAAYLGGAIATHLEHQQSVMMAVIIQCLVWITAAIRFPELSKRLVGKSG